MHLNPHRGFSLVEVLVALVICSVGLLGLAKMESIALASTGVAGGRSLAAIQAESLASAMHANRAYWAQAGTPPTQFTISAANGIVDPTNILNVAATCTSPAAAPATPLCTAAQIAAYDVQQWQISLAAVLPAYLATVSCSTLATQPVNCNIQLQWQERAAQAQTQVGNTAAQNANAAAAVAQAQYAAGNVNNGYILYVEP